MDRKDGVEFESTDLPVEKESLLKVCEHFDSLLLNMNEMETNVLLFLIKNEKTLRHYVDALVEKEKKKAQQEINSVLDQTLSFFHSVDFQLLERKHNLCEKEIQVLIDLKYSIVFGKKKEFLLKFLNRSADAYNADFTCICYLNVDLRLNRLLERIHAAAEEKKENGLNFFSCEVDVADSSVKEPVDIDLGAIRFMVNDE